MKIGVFDSGIGGLTVLEKLVNKYPLNQYIYYGDNLNVPYGNKSIEELKKIGDKIIEFFIKKNVDFIIIACGTMSSNLISYFNNKYDVLIYDIISPTIRFISSLNNVGVIATFKTIESGVFSGYEQVACSTLASLIENKENVFNDLESYLSNFNKIDYLVLGCTHYPLISKDIIKLLPDIKLIDMGDVLINNLKIVNSYESVKIYFGKIDDIVLSNINSILSFPYDLEEIDA